MSNAEQAEFWSNEAGPNWTALQPEMDAVLRPVLDLVLEVSRPGPGQSVLDIGCGTGASLLALAPHVGAGGRVLGVDISTALTEMARERTRDFRQVEVHRADAAEADLHGPHDLAVSRFGVMFFADTSAAFRHIATALKPEAELVMAAWGPAPKNPYFMDPAAVARAHLGEMPKTDRTLPGPFAWEDATRVRDMLARAGLMDVTVDEHHLKLTPMGGPRDIADLTTRIGSAQSALRHHDASDAEREAIVEALAERWAQYQTPEGMRIPACINLVRARVPA